MTRAPLSHRERVRLALAHQETDRVPLALVCSGINEPARTAFAARVQERHGLPLETYLDSLLDIRSVAPTYAGPRLAADTDIWGVRRKTVRFGAGEYSEIDRSPLSGEITPADIAAHPWPSPDWFDYAALPARIRALQADGERCLMAYNGNPFETAWALRGFEQALADMAVEPELVHALMGRVTDFYTAYFHALLSAARGAIDLVFTADDIAGQNGLLLSLPMWERFIKPHHVRLNRVIHEHGARVIYHSDGAIMAAVPGLIDMGIDVLQALQFDAVGMNAALLKHTYGDRLCFEGGVSVQRTLPFGTPADVRAEVRHLLATLGAGGGYILGPSHCIQAGTPPENIRAMFEAAIEEPCP